MIRRRDRIGHRAGFVKLEIRQRVHDREAFQNIGNRRLHRTIPLHMPEVRLIGNVEPAPLRNAERTESFRKRGEKRAQERDVFVTERIRLPTEYLLFHAVHRCHDLRRVFGSPLRKEMRDLEIFHPEPPADLDPTVKPCITETPAVRGLFHVNELHRRTVDPHKRIERRREYRGQDRIYPVVRRRLQIALDDPPVFLRPYRHAVVRRQTIAVEPFRHLERLLRQSRRQYRDGHHRFSRDPILLHEPHRHRICAGRDVLRNPHRHIQGGKKCGGRKYPIPVRRRHQKIGVQTGGGPQIRVVVPLRVAWSVHRNLLHGLHRIRQRAGGGQRIAAFLSRFRHRVRDHVVDFLAAQCGQCMAFRLFGNVLVHEALFHGRDVFQDNRHTFPHKCAFPAIFLLRYAGNAGFYITVQKRSAH